MTGFAASNLIGKAIGRTRLALLFLACLNAISMSLFGESTEPVSVRVEHLQNLDQIVELVDDLHASFPLATVKKVNANLLLIIPRSEEELTKAAVRRLKNAILEWDRTSATDVGPKLVQLKNLRNVDDVVEKVDQAPTAFETATAKTFDDRSLLIIPRPGKTLTSAAVSSLQATIADWDAAAGLGVHPEPIPVNHLQIEKVVDSVTAASDVFPTATVKKLGPRTLIIVPRTDQQLTSAAIFELEKVIRNWDQSVSPNPTRGTARIIQLFHLRKAQDIANALSSLQDRNIRITSIGNDRLVIQGGERASIDRIRRLVTVLDQPRPRIALQLWNLEVSNRDSEEIASNFKRARNLIRFYDGIIRQIHTAGWNRFLEIVKHESNGFFDSSVWSYATDLYGSRGEGGEADGCTYSHDLYCLGYDLNLEGTPSLSRMIIMLALSSKPLYYAKKVSFWHVNLSERLIKEQQEINNCEEEFSPTICLDPRRSIRLTRTRDEFRNLFEGEQVKLFQAAILDYLFHYKWSLSYPERFSAYNLARSADRIDAFFYPIVEALGADIEALVQEMTEHPSWPTAPKRNRVAAFIPKLWNGGPSLAGISNSGRVKVVSLSADPSSLKSETVSYFDMTPPPTFLIPERGGAGGDGFSETGSQINNGSSSTVSESVSVSDGRAVQSGPTMLSPLTAGTVTAALRALQASEPVTAKLNRQLSLDFTAHSLAEASSAELSLKLTVSQEEPSTNGTASASSFVFDRIANTELSTTVRVPGSRLFEISNIALDVQVSRPDGLVPIVGHVWNGVFGQVPLLNRLFKWKREPSTVYHRNLIVVTAVIAPTAADLALGLRYHNDILRTDTSTDSTIAKNCLDSLLFSHQIKIHGLLDLQEYSPPEVEIDKNCKPTEVPSLDRVVPSKIAIDSINRVNVVLKGDRFFRNDTIVLFDGVALPTISVRWKDVGTLEVDLALIHGISEGQHKLSVLTSFGQSDELTLTIAK